MASRGWWIALVLLLVATAGRRGEVAAQTPTASADPLHRRIDRLIEAAAIGPLAPACTDADFVRRVYLDLTGIIPTADQARAYVDDRNPGKRGRLIDELLASPAFLRHMTTTLDVLLMERKPEKVVKQPEWEAYLYQSLAESKPLDLLVEELLKADGADEKMRPAARFTLDRDAEPNLLTRDIGRLVFGMDLQCCQCHDHPLVDDYFQDDYYGLFAFVQRTSLFTDAKTKLVSLTEKADGEASFKSVFTGASSDKAIPRLPKGAALLEEPSYAKNDEYQVKPDKAVRGVPKFSRRAALAERVGGSREFARNLANRLWALMFGRGLVHPLDLHHAANPPSHPELLTLLADELTAGNFQLRPFLRELALTRAYGRGCDAPRPEAVNFADIEARLVALRKEREERQSALPTLEVQLAEAKTAFKAGREARERGAAEIAKCEGVLVVARQEVEKAEQAHGDATAVAKRAVDRLAALEKASQDVATLATVLPGDAAVAAAAESLVNRATELASASRVAQQLIAQRLAAADAARARASEAQQSLDLASSARPTVDSLAALEKVQLGVEDALADARYEVQALDARIALAESALAYRDLANAGHPTAEAAWLALVERWTNQVQIAALKPLTPEQLAASMMQAAGVFDAQVAAAKAKVSKAPPAELSSAAEADKPRIGARLAQLELLNQVRGTFREFVRLYGGESGQEFQATVNQALFFGNGNVVDDWLKPAGENLVSRLRGKVLDPGAIADELCWAVFSRPATELDRRRVADYLNERQTEKPAAIGEMVWGLLGSTEFRFNH